MSLQVWLPLNGNLNNQGLSEVTVTNSGATVDSGGKIGSCYLFNPAKISLTPSFLTSFYGDFSFSLWLKVNSFTTSWETYLQIGIGTAPWNSYRIGLLKYGETSNLIFCISDGNSSTQSNCQTSYSAGDWYHFTCTYSKTEQKMRIYKNGVLSNTYSTPIIPKFSDVPYITLGQVNDGSYKTNCLINDFRLYNHCLSAKEVKEISKGLVCHYKLDNKGFGNPNLITTMSSGGRTTLNGKYGLNADFSQNTDTYGYFNVSPALELDSTYTLSFDVSNFPVGSTWNFKLWNNANYDIGTITKDGRYTYTFVPSESKLPSGYSLTKFLFDDGGRTNPSGMVYFTNFKIEKSNKPTPWCPHTSDSLYASLGLNSAVESDCSGNNYNGTLSESLPYASNSPRYSGCYYFNSNSKRVTLPTINMSGFSNSFSIAWWGKAPSYSSLMYWGFSNGNRLNYYSGIYCNTGDGSSNPYYKPGTTTTISAPSVNTWHHFVMVGDGSSNKLYMDGELYGVAATYKGITGSTIVINGWDSSTNYKTNGYISDFRIYSTVLSASAVKELYSTAASVDKNGNMYAYEFKEE